MAEEKQLIHIVIAAGPLVLGAYTRPDSAHLHARCITGASVVPCDLLEQVPEHVRDDLQEEWDEEETPVVEPPKIR